MLPRATNGRLIAARGMGQAGRDAGPTPVGRAGKLDAAGGSMRQVVP
jgi:hypothetical protein